MIVGFGQRSVYILTFMCVLVSLLRIPVYIAGFAARSAKNILRRQRGHKSEDRMWGQRCVGAAVPGVFFFLLSALLPACLLSLLFTFTTGINSCRLRFVLEGGCSIEKAGEIYYYADGPIRDRKQLNLRREINSVAVSVAQSRERGISIVQLFSDTM